MTGPTTSPEPARDRGPVVLHVGLMKTGTTFLQGTLAANRDQLLQTQDTLFPGPKWRRQVEAAKDVLGSPSAKPGSWESVRAEIAAHPGRALISMEFLAPAPVETVLAIAEAFPDRDVRAVITVRDLGRAVPAMWQESLQNRGTMGWRDYVEALESQAPEGQRFWRHQAADRIVSTWASGLGPDHVTVVTVPPAGAPRDLLWDRFCRAVGLRAYGFEEVPRQNESLGAASSLLLLALNRQLTGLDRAAYMRRAKNLAKGDLARRRSQEHPIGYPVPTTLRVRSQQLVESITNSGVAVVGDLADLEPQDVAGVDPDEVPISEQFDAAVYALARLVHEVKRVSR